MILKLQRLDGFGKKKIENKTKRASQDKARRYLKQAVNKLLAAPASCSISLQPFPSASQLLIVAEPYNHWMVKKKSCHKLFTALPQLNGRFIIRFSLPSLRYCYRFRILFRWPLSLAILGDSPALSHVHGLPHVASDINNNKKKEKKLKIPPCMLQSFLQPSISLTQREQPCFYNSRRPEGNQQLIAVNFLSLTTALAKKKKEKNSASAAPCGGYNATTDLERRIVAGSCCTRAA